jgi:mRNA interferase HigB
MHVVARPRLTAFGATYPDALDQLETWYHVMRRARFRSPHELKQSFPAADFISDGLVVFNIRGNNYRLVAHLKYATDTNMGRAYIRHIFTHADYDLWNRKRRGQ